MIIRPAAATDIGTIVAMKRGLIDSIADVDWAEHADWAARAVMLHATPMAITFYERVGFHVGVPKPGDEHYPQMWLDF